ncbi:MAG: hypothetical protein AMXMBFR82_10840 [Candidatus Hydrogenedentota bacterium]
MKELRVHVERIVRPIRAGVLRKNRMRDELLGHLKTAFEEERFRTRSDAEAEQRAVARLGDPDALREELQRAVPWYERLGHVRLPIRLQVEDYGLARVYGWRGSARFATEIVLILIVGAPFLFGLARFALFLAGENRPIRTDWGDGLLTIAAILLMMWASLFVTLWLSDIFGIRKLLAPWSNTPAVVKACFTNLLWIGAIGLFLLASTTFADFIQSQPGPDSTATILLAALKGIPQGPWLGAFLLLALMVTMTIAMRFERRQYLEWGCLDVESEKPLRQGD